MKLIKALTFVLVAMSFSSFAFAGAPAPEIDPGMAGSALMFIGGAVLIIRSRRK